MTPARQPQHCDHEIVCWMYRENKIPQGNQPCMRNHYGCITCTADTRTSATAPECDCDCLSCNPDMYISCERRINPDRSRYTVEQIADIDKQIRKAAKAEREQVLDSLIARIEKELLTNQTHLYDSKSAYLSVLAWSRGLKAGGTL